MTDNERDTAGDDSAHRRDDAADNVDYRAHPERYEIGRGEEGVFKVQPYKSELLPLWGYANRETADEGGRTIYERFRQYERDDDFVGMDMARKYLQMGTREQCDTRNIPAVRSTSTVKSATRCTGRTRTNARPRSSIKRG